MCDHGLGYFQRNDTCAKIKNNVNCLCYVFISQTTFDTGVPGRGAGGTLDGRDEESVLLLLPDLQTLMGVY